MLVGFRTPFNLNSDQLIFSCSILLSSVFLVALLMMFVVGRVGVLTKTLVGDCFVPKPKLCRLDCLFFYVELLLKENIILCGVLSSLKIAFWVFWVKGVSFLFWVKILVKGLLKVFLRLILAYINSIMLNCNINWAFWE